MFKNVYSIVLAAVGFMLLTPQPASAQRYLERAADDYRQAVKAFEKEVFRSRHMGRDQRRFADDLEDQTSRIRSAVRDRNRAYRILPEIDRAAVIQQQIEASILANPACPSRGILFPLWQRVIASHASLASQANALLGGGFGPDPYGRDPYGRNSGFGGGVIDAVPPVGFQGGYRVPGYDAYGSNRINTFRSNGLTRTPRYGSYYGSGAGWNRGGQFPVETRVFRYPVDRCDNGFSGVDVGRAVIGALLQR